MKVSRSLLPFIVISVLCAGGVELFYQFALKTLFQPPLTAQEAGTIGQEPGGDSGKAGKTKNYQVIIDRNLFGTGPIGPETGGGGNNPLAGLSATSLDLLLLGTVAGEREDKRAIIMDKESKKQEIYHIGDMVQGAKIKDILRGRIILNFRGRDEILDMTEARQYFAETPAAPPALLRQTPLAAPEEAPRDQPADAGMKITPPLRKFSVKAGPQ